MFFKKRVFRRSQVESESCFQLDRFDSQLLPQNNRPLEPSVLLALKELFNRSNANTTALHMLSVDCQVRLARRRGRFLRWARRHVTDAPLLRCCRWRGSPG